jgi:hypothetical protein
VSDILPPIRGPVDPSASDRRRRLITIMAIDPPPFPYPTLLVHADDHLSPTTDIAPTLHPSTTYHYPPNWQDLRPVADGHADGFQDDPVYTRLSYSTTERVEKVLGELMGGKYPITAHDRSCIDVLFRIDCDSCAVCPCQSSAGRHFLGGRISWD